jgi:hypothetical protein
MPRGGVPKHHPDIDPSDAFLVLPIEQRETMKRLLAMLPERRDCKTAKKELIETSRSLSIYLYESKRLNRRTLQTELNSFDKRLSKRQPSSAAEAEAMLGEISREARKCVEAVARRRLRGRKDMPDAELLLCAVKPSLDPPPLQIDGLAPSTKLHAWVRMAAVAQLPERVWLPIKPHSKQKEVQDGLSPVYQGEELVPVKRPADNALRFAVASLAQIWLEQCGETATMGTSMPEGRKYGPFLDFCRAVIEPVYAARGLKKPAVHSAVQEHLYPPKEGPDDVGQG